MAGRSGCVCALAIPAAAAPGAGSRMEDPAGRPPALLGNQKRGPAATGPAAVVVPHNGWVGRWVGGREKAGRVG